METITISYDATNPAIKGLLEAFLKLDGVIKVDESKPAKSARKRATKKERVIDQIAKDYSAVKSGKVKTRPVSQLLDEI